VTKVTRGESGAPCQCKTGLLERVLSGFATPLDERAPIARSTMNASRLRSRVDKSSCPTPRCESAGVSANCQRAAPWIVAIGVRMGRRCFWPSMKRCSSICGVDLLRGGPGRFAQPQAVCSINDPNLDRLCSFASCAKKIAASRVGALDRGNVPTQPTYDSPRKLFARAAAPSFRRRTILPHVPTTTGP
jgi:hypothetical protein